MPTNRKSTRLPGYDYTLSGAYFVTLVTHQRTPIFGDVIHDRVVLTQAGVIAQTEWLRLPARFPFITLDELSIMPNHVHGLLFILPPGARQPAPIPGKIPLASPQPSLPPLPPPTEPSVGARQEDETLTARDTIASTLLSSKTHAVGGGCSPGSLGAVIGGYKAQVARLVNGLRHSPGAPVWQRNFYDHILRTSQDFASIRFYISENPLKWLRDDENFAGPS